MVTVILKHSVIKKARSKVLVTVAFSGLFSYPSRYNPSQKRVARCTNIPHTGALPTVKGVGQRLRKGFQSSGVCETQKRSLGNASIDEKLQGFGTIQRYLYVRVDWPMRVGEQVKILPTFESLSSAAEIRHSARNTR